MKKITISITIILAMAFYRFPSSFIEAAQEPRTADAGKIEQKVLQELTDIKDPERGGSLTQFAPVNGVKVSDGKAVININLPSYCPLKGKIINDIKERIGKLPGIREVDVILDQRAKACSRLSRDTCSNALASSAVAAPQIINLAVAPVKVRPGDIMTITAKLKDASGIASATIDMGGIETLSLSRKEGTAQNGVWKATWKVHDTKLKIYTSTLAVFNKRGLRSFSSIDWSDPPSWWNGSYKYCQQITVTNNVASTLTAGYTAWITLNTSTLIGASKMRVDGDDLRIVYWNGSSNVELDRHLRYINTANTEAYFKIQANIPASSADNNYFVYYGYNGAFNPPVNGSNVYEFWEPFDNLSNWGYGSGQPSVANGIVTLPASPAAMIYHTMGYLASTYNKVFEQCVKVDLTSAQRVWWGVVMQSWPFDRCGNQCCDGTYTERELILIDSVINDVAQTSLTAVATPGTGDDTRSSSWDPGTGYNIYTEKWKASEVKYYHNQTLWATHAVDVTSDSYVSLELWNYSSTVDLYADWYAVRRYIDPEPSTTLGGAEFGGGGTSVGGGTIRNATIR